MTSSRPDLKTLILGFIPEDGASISNQALLASLQKAAPEITESGYQAMRDALVAAGRIEKGRGRGGSVSLVLDADTSEDAHDEEGANEDVDEFALETQDQPTGGKRPSVARKAKKGRAQSSGPAQVLSYRHGDMRVNNPEVGMVHPENDPDQPRTVYAYDPHIDPALMFDSARARVESMIDDALASNDVAVMREALAELKAMQAPYLNWAGKAERTSFDVDTVSLHVHERVDPATILANARKRMKGEKPLEIFRQADLFAAPFENLPLRQALDFYHHEKGWSNRLIAGDSLLVMNSLLQKEAMAGKVQMIYIDPPYGIKFGSNFQPFTNKRDVKDGADADLTQEPEMIKAFRDTWELGIHSYLTYLRDRLLLSKDLLHESGSVFIQISDENLHHVTEIASNVFGSENQVSIITIQKTSGATAELLSNTADYLVWYAKNKKETKYKQLYQFKDLNGIGGGEYNFIQEWSGKSRAIDKKAERQDPEKLAKLGRVFAIHPITSQRPPGDFPINFMGAKIRPKSGYWKTGEKGFEKLIKAGRVLPAGSIVKYRRYFDDFPVMPYNNLWDDVSSGASSNDPKVESLNAVC